MPEVPFVVLGRDVGMGVDCSALVAKPPPLTSFRATCHMSRATYHAQVENRRGAHDDQLALLPTEVVPPSGRRLSDGSPAACAICLEETAPGEVLKRLPCGHCFHGGCLDTWLKTKAVCPVCQRGLD